VSLDAAFSTAEVAQLVIGLPGLPMHLRVDPLAAFFLIVIGAGVCGTSLFSAGYFRTGEGTPPGLLSCVAPDPCPAPPATVVPAAA